MCRATNPFRWVKPMVRDSQRLTSQSRIIPKIAAGKRSVTHEPVNLFFANRPSGNRVDNVTRNNVDAAVWNNWFEIVFPHRVSAGIALGRPVCASRAKVNDRNTILFKGPGYVCKYLLYKGEKTDVAFEDDVKACHYWSSSQANALFRGNSVSDTLKQRRGPERQSTDKLLEYRVPGAMPLPSRAIRFAHCQNCGTEPQQGPRRDGS